MTESSISAGDFAVDDTLAFSRCPELLLREQLTRHAEIHDAPRLPELINVSAPRNLDIPGTQSMTGRIASTIGVQSGALDLEYAIPNAHRLCRPSIGDNAVAAAASYAEQVDAAVLVNPSPARTLVPQILHARPILLPHAGEAAAVWPCRTPAATWLQDMTGAPVVMTVGAAGATVVDQGEVYSIAPPFVDVVDTTGAGDTFAGVLAAMIVQGHDLRSAVEQAVIAAAMSVTSRGAR